MWIPGFVACNSICFWAFPSTAFPPWWWTAAWPRRLDSGQSADPGDQLSRHTPKAGVFAEGAALAVASALIAKLRNGGKATEYNGFGACYVEFGGGTHRQG
jgi:hypothetical protein